MIVSRQTNSIRRELEAAIEVYAMLLSRELAFFLLQSLPPEIRLIIFEYLTIEDYPIAPGLRDLPMEGLNPEQYEGDVEEE